MCQGFLHHQVDFLFIFHLRRGYRRMKQNKRPNSEKKKKKKHRSVSKPCWTSMFHCSLSNGCLVTAREAAVCGRCVCVSVNPVLHTAAACECTKIYVTVDDSRRFVQEIRSWKGTKHSAAETENNVCQSQQPTPSAQHDWHLSKSGAVCCGLNVKFKRAQSTGEIMQTFWVTFLPKYVSYPLCFPWSSHCC